MVSNLNNLIEHIQKINDMSNETEIGHKKVIVRVNLKNNSLIAQIQFFYDMDININIENIKKEYQEILKEQISNFIYSLKQNPLVEDICMLSELNFRIILKNDLILNSEFLTPILQMENYNQVADYIIDKSSTNKLLNNLDVLCHSFIDYFNNVTNSISIIEQNSNLKKAI